MIDLKRKLAARELTVGSWITLAHPAIAEIMARAGFDWLVIDLEHSVITIREAEELIRTIGLCGVVPLVRLSANDAVQIKRVMDAGAHGVIVPMVNTRNDAEQAVRAVKYPPAGTRGVGLARAQGYGVSFDQYKDWLSKESIVIVQIEHVEAIRNLEEILSVEGIDGSIIGPYDLSGSLGYPGEFERQDVKKTIDQYEKVCMKMGKPTGYHVVQPDPSNVMEYKEKGYVFIAVGVDTLYLGSKCRDVISTIKGSRQD